MGNGEAKIYVQTMQTTVYTEEYKSTMLINEVKSFY